jgi:hypothetical protein
MFVSVTRLRIRSIFFLPKFFIYNQRTVAQIVEAEGFVTGMLHVDRKLAFWTTTIWESDAAMRAYRNGGAHRAAMPKLSSWCDEASVAHWEQGEPILPSLNEARRRMLEEGRFTKVEKPSADQTAGIIPQPQPREKMATLLSPKKKG